MRKYSLYAIGEIALVVIGILIALSINNWNEERRKENLEIDILTEIKTNLKTDLEDHQRNIDFIEKRLEGSEKLLINLKYSNQFNDSIDYLISRIAFSAPHANPVVTGYNRMLSSNEEIISNDSVRAQISLVYENHYTWLSNTFTEMFLTQTAHLNKLIIENFVIKESNSLFPKYEPVNFSDLRKNNVFKTALEAHMQHWKILQLRYKRHLEEFKKVIISIENELIAKD
jgi:hypothetical protein